MKRNVPRRAAFWRLLHARETATDYSRRRSSRAFIRLSGLSYLETIGLLARSLGAHSYFEIGSGPAHSLGMVDCPSIAVDPSVPAVRCTSGRSQSAISSRWTSDAFFRTYRVTDYFKDGIDLAFLDGMHRFEYLLRDFFNTEACCRPELA